MHIMVGLSKKEVREIVSFSLESRFKASVVEGKTAKDAIDYFADKKNAKVDLVVCEYPGIGDMLFKQLAKLGIPVVICALNKPAPEDPNLARLQVVGYANMANLIDSLYTIIGEHLKKAKAAQGEEADPEESPEEPPMDESGYCRIRTNLLIRVGPLKADIYIRLSATKFIKLFREGDSFDEADYRKYLVQKRVEYLYLKKDESSEFVSKFRADLLNILKSDLLDNKGAQELSVNVHETVQDLINKIGPTKEIQDVVKTSVMVTMKTMGRNPRLSQILEKMQMDKDKYISSHSMMVSQIACALAVAMEWSSETTFQKLSLASFLHDVSLTNHRLAAVQTQAELERKRDQFTEDEYRAYMNHPNRGAELARQFNEVPADVDTIIVQHHEQPDGLGFPRGMTHTYISPLASLFIAAHDLVAAVFEQDKKFIMEEFLESIRDRYNAGNFKKIYKCLGELKL